MKRVGFLKERITSLDNLYEAYRKACKGKLYKKEVKRFADNFEENIRILRELLLSETFVFGKYHFFTIHDPKERMICAASFPERIVHHAIMNVCHQYFDRTLIDTTYATRKGKGVYAALTKAQWAMEHYKYSVKLDYRKYYDTICHGVLKLKLRRMFKDQWLLNIFDKIIDSYEVELERGLPIGNLTSQYFANLYLSELDHKAKEKWGAIVYIRYMDDIMIACDDKEKLKCCVKTIVEFSEKVLGLTLKQPVYATSNNGQVFLGYRVKPYRLLLAGRSKRRFRKKLLTYNRMIEDGRWNERQYEEHILPLLAFCQHAESRIFRGECMKIK